MEARLHPEKFLGREIGDAHVIRTSPFIPDGIPVSGCIYEVETGKRQTVVSATS
jgi:carbonic anhydrase